jgi:hypothetical protein
MIVIHISFLAMFLWIKDWHLSLMMDPLMCEGTHQGDTNSSSPFGLGGTRFSTMAEGIKSSITVKYFTDPLSNYVLFYNLLILLLSDIL